MNTISNEVGGGRRRRRNHSAEFKAQVVGACRPPGIPIAAVAVSSGVNATLPRPGGAHPAPFPDAALRATLEPQYDDQRAPSLWGPYPTFAEALGHVDELRRPL